MGRGKVGQCSIACYSRKFFHLFLISKPTPERHTLLAIARTSFKLHSSSKLPRARKSWHSSSLCMITSAFKFLKTSSCPHNWRVDSPVRRNTKMKKISPIPVNFRASSPVAIDSVILNRTIGQQAPGLECDTCKRDTQKEKYRAPDKLKANGEVQLRPKTVT